MQNSSLELFLIEISNLSERDETIFETPISSVSLPWPKIVDSNWLFVCVYVAVSEV